MHSVAQYNFVHVERGYKGPSETEVVLVASRPTNTINCTLQSWLFVIVLLCSLQTFYAFEFWALLFLEEYS